MDDRKTINRSKSAPIAGVGDYIGIPEAVPLKSNPAVFLDRDGVLTIPEFRAGRSFAPRSLANFRIYPEARDAVASLKANEFIVIVVTNQPDVGAGLMDSRVLDAMHEQLRREVPVDDIEVCFETKAQATNRRKPGPGMLLGAASKWNIDFSRSYMVGDRDSDIVAGNAVGCSSVFLDWNYSAESRPVGQAATVKSLREAVSWILADKHLKKKSEVEA